MSKKNSKPFLHIEFDRKNKTHEFIAGNISGEEMIMSALTIITKVEKDSGMPFAVATRLAKMQQMAEADKQAQKNINKANKKAKAKKKGKK